MELLAKLDKDSILAEKIFQEIFEQEDEIYKARMILSLTDRAAELGVKKKFEELLKAYKRVDREMKQKERKKPITMLDKWTNFLGPYDNMFCGAWIAGEDGVYAQNDSQVDAVACYHPILPVERMKNLETGEEQIKIAYKRNGRWDEIIVPKTMVTSASKIVALSGRGISVTSENAKLLVRFLSDVENMNDSHIKVQYSTSKLGWIKDQFIPYDTEIVFDGDQRFRQAYESVSERGNWKIWQSHMLKLRKTKRLEIKFMMAASFASVLVARMIDAKYSTVYSWLNPDKCKKPKPESKTASNADRHKCRTCMFRATGNTKGAGCSYIEITGHSRKCSVEECSVYQKGNAVSKRKMKGFYE